VPFRSWASSATSRRGGSLDRPSGCHGRVDRRDRALCRFDLGQCLQGPASTEALVEIVVAETVARVGQALPVCPSASE
jgi:hypothetical protein